MRFKFNDLLILILLFVFVAAFPIDLIQVSSFFKVMIRCGLRLLLIGYYIYIIIRDKIKVFGVSNIKNALLCLPFFIICSSNFIASGLFGGFTGPTMEIDMLIILSVESLLIAISEEIIFRLFIHNSLIFASSIKRTFASAGIFALMHLLNLANISSLDGLVNVLIQTVYTFGLGILLGIMYEYSHCLTACVILHFCFNFFNKNLFLYFGGHTTELAFYLTAVVVGVIAAIYAFIIYKFVFSKFSRYFSE